MPGETAAGEVRPVLRMLMLLALAFSCAVIMLGIGGLLCLALYDINVFTDQQVLERLDEPGVPAANRLMLFMQHLGLFIVPGLLLARMISRRPMTWVGADSVPAALTFAVTALAVATVQPAVTAIGELNAAMSLPPALSGLEETMRQLEESAKAITGVLLADNDAGGFALNVLLIAVLPAFGEELIFRGLLQRMLGEATGRRHLAVWLAAFLFSFMHLQFYGFLPRFLLGAFLGYLFLWSDSLWLPVAAHFCNNLLGILLALPLGGSPLEEQLPGADAGLVALSIVLTAGLLFLIRKRTLLSPLPSGGGGRGIPPT